MSSKWTDTPASRLQNRALMAPPLVNVLQERADEEVQEARFRTGVEDERSPLEARPGEGEHWSWPKQWRRGSCTREFSRCSTSSGPTQRQHDSGRVSNLEG